MDKIELIIDAYNRTKSIYKTALLLDIDHKTVRKCVKRSCSIYTKKPVKRNIKTLSKRPFKTNVKLTPAQERQVISLRKEKEYDQKKVAKIIYKQTGVNRYI